MRGDHCNRGRMHAAPEILPGLRIRHFRTGNAVFSTPVIGADETLYVGSADHTFYAFDPVNDRERWRYDVGEVVDSAATIGKDGTVFVPSGNGLFAFTADGKKKWHLDLLRDASHFSPSTMYWWEGNAVVGPNGWIYAGCDDFHVYAMNPEGDIQWKALTGCCVWSSACFGPDNTLYISSFDFCVYAIDMQSGRVKWKRSMKNFVASSPMLAPDGTLYVGSFDGSLYALDAASGEISWSIPTGGPIYATAAMADDGSLYVGSSDGNVYCIDPTTQSVRWAYDTGDCVRGSAAIGLDPEGKRSFLVYVGSGNGTIYAFEPGGTVRWSYDTLPLGPARGGQYCNINASIALGRHGLATASANGDIIYVPYDVAQTHYGHPGFTVHPRTQFVREGALLYPVSVGGVLAAAPVNGHAIEADPADTVSLKLVHREGNRTRPVEIDASSLHVTLHNDTSYRATVNSDGTHLHLVPGASVPAGRHTVDIRATYRSDGKTHEFSSPCIIDVRPVDRPTSVEGLSFRIEQMSVYAPAIVATFDQIGIASVWIDVTIARFDPVTGNVAAWGVQKFGIGPDGEPTAGIPVPRSSFFAFGGSYKNGTLILEAKDCRFELTAFPVPLDTLRFTASVTERGVIASSLLAQVDTRRALLHMIVSWLPVPRRGGGARLRERMRQLRAWFPDDRPIDGVANLWLVARRTVPQWFWAVVARVWRPWSMIDARGRFAGVGTFLATPAPAPSHGGLHVERFVVEKRRVRAVFTADPSYDRGDACPGILLVDRDTGLPVPCDYALLRIERDKYNVPTNVVLDLPKLPHGSHVDAVLFVDLALRATIPLLA